jgi:DNA-binding NtrC family response regulator
MVVEDEAAVRGFVKEVLTGSGYHVLEAANADEALAISRRYTLPIHLVVTDMVMPGPDGRELAARLKYVHPESKVVLVSGYSEALAADKAVGPEVHFLSKPFTPHQLIGLVGEVLSVGGS